MDHDNIMNMMTEEWHVAVAVAVAVAAAAVVVITGITARETNFEGEQEEGEPGMEAGMKTEVADSLRVTGVAVEELVVEVAMVPVGLNTKMMIQKWLAAKRGTGVRTSTSGVAIDPI